MKRRAGEKYLIDPVRYSFWMFGEDGSELHENAQNATKTRQFSFVAKRWIARLDRQGIAGFTVVVEWRDPEKTPVGGIVERTRKKSPAVERKLAHGMRHFFSLTKDGDRLDGRAPSKKKTSDASRRKTKKKREKPSMAQLLDKIRARPPVGKCKPIFARGLEIVPTPSVMRTCPQRDVMLALERFVRCDWGDVPRSTVARNNRVTRKPRPGEAVYGIYQARDVEFWIVASPDSMRAAVILPEEIS